ncbi:aa3-type cytochrome c oxidase subunit IV [Marimonas lutisalis]|nr:aa3-type cytochrome c oxidase subunit IV [Marimonas lutisalis]
MSEHKHGEMNIFVQEKTFEGFIKFMTRSAIVIVLLLLFIALVNA